MAKKQHIKLIDKKSPQRLDEATVEIVRGINCLLLKAQKEQLTTITTILKDARESIAWWAVHDDYRESNAEKLLHQITLDGGLHTALDFLAKFASIKDDLIRDELLQTIEQFQLRNAQITKATLEA